MLQDGVFFAATKLYGITFKERKDMPGLPPRRARLRGVRRRRLSRSRSSTATTSSATTRAAARGCDSFVDQSRLLGTKPVVYNVANFTKPAPGQPALICLRRRDDDVPRVRPRAARPASPNVKYPTLGHRRRATSSSSRRSSTSTGRSSRRSSPTTRSTTRPATPMPQALVDKIKKAQTFNQGYVHDRVPRRGAARHGVAHAAGRRAARRTSTRSRSAALERCKRRPARGAAALPHDLLRAHLGRRLRGRLLRLPLDARCSTTTRTTGSRRTAA